MTEPGRTTSAGSRPTVSALLDAAETEFAGRGFEQASLRAIMRRAGTDPGAIHYHFGDRAGLAAAVLARLLAPLNDHRLALLHELEAEQEDGPIALVPLVDALLRPDVEMAAALDARERGRAALVGTIYLRPARFVTEQVEQHFRPVAGRFHPHLGAIISHVPAEIVAWRVRWAAFGLVGAVLSDPAEPFPPDTGPLLERLVTTTAGALSAPFPQ